jgi:hypothetical protein
MMGLIMITPFSWLAADQQSSMLVMLFIASSAVMKILSTIGRELSIRSEKIPFGIINLELSWSEQRAASIVKAWSDRALIAKAVQQTQLDFVLLLLYPATLSLACTMIAGSAPGLMATVGNIFSWAVLLCTPLDAFENIMLLKMLSGFCNSPIPQLTTISATLKFFLFVSSVLYMLVMLILKV